MNYYIQGNKEKADQIKAAFEKLGYDTGNLGFTSSQLYYTMGEKVELMCTKSLQNLIKTHPDYKELKLPKPHYDISNFYAGMPVLVRDNNGEEWRHTAFSHMTSRFYENKFAAGCTYWCQCIPFNDDTKHLLGTTEPCDEQYINW